MGHALAAKFYKSAGAADQAGTLIARGRRGLAGAAHAAQDIGHAATQPAMHLPGMRTPTVPIAPMRSARPAPAMRDVSQASGPVNSYLPGFAQHDARLARVERRIAARPDSARNQRWSQGIAQERKRLGNDLAMSAGPEVETSVLPAMRRGHEVAARPGGMSAGDVNELQQRWLTPRPRAAAGRNMSFFDPADVARQSEQRGVSSLADNHVSRFIAQQRAHNASIPQAIAPAKLAMLMRDAARAAMTRFALRTA